MATENLLKTISPEATSPNLEAVITEKYLTFFIDKQLYAIPSGEVVEIMSMQPITYIPNLPSFIKGVINLRGKIVPLIDIRIKFNKDELPYGSRTNIIVVETNDLNAGLIVDTVDDVIDVYQDQINKSQNYSKNNDNNYVYGIITMNESIMMLDLLKILDDQNAQYHIQNTFLNIKAKKTIINQEQSTV